jgi:hypothetical protein
MNLVIMQDIEALTVRLYLVLKELPNSLLLCRDHYLSQPLLAHKGNGKTVRGGRSLAESLTPSVTLPLLLFIYFLISTSE